MKKYPFDAVFVEESAKDDAVTEDILSGLKGVALYTVKGHQRAKDFVFENYPDPVSGGKRVLFLTRNSGEKIKRCPCSRGRFSCGYHVINLQNNCPIDCSYCILQKYLANPFISIFTNIEDYLAEIDAFIGGKEASHFRVGTGELTDSLALDYLTSHSKFLVPFFSKRPNTVLELKTKSDCIENLLQMEHGNNIVVSWSLNPQALIDSEEIFSASLDERLKSAGACAKAGYRIAFHFDPIIAHPGWEEDYGAVVEKLFLAVDGDLIDWISLGGFRYDPKFKPVALERFGSSRLFAEEFALNGDNKMRYVGEARDRLYSFMRERIRAKSKKAHLYLCMEGEGAWEKFEGLKNKGGSF